MVTTTTPSSHNRFAGLSLARSVSATPGGSGGLKNSVGDSVHFGQSDLQRENARLRTREKELERRLARQHRIALDICDEIMADEMRVQGAKPAPHFGGGSSRKDLEAENARLKTKVARLEKKLADKKADNARMQDLLYHDELTGIHNLPYYNRVAEQLYKRAVNDGQPLSFIMADLDRFKGINDTFGHDAGDEALRRFAQALEKSVGKDGYAFRLGGDEFVAILPNVDQGGARQIAADIRERIKKESFAWEGANHPIQLASSQGIATLNDKARPFHLKGKEVKVNEHALKIDTTVTCMQDLRNVADQVMYKAKTDAKEFQQRNPIGRARVEHAG